MMNECRSTRFISSSSSSPNLYVANCGPSVGISMDQIQLAFSKFGEVKSVCAADQSGARVVVSFSKEISAKAALEAFDGKPCPYLSDRILHIRYSSILQTSSSSSSSQSQVNGFLSVVSLEASELQIPGIYLLKDFVTSKEEEELLSAVDCRLWKNLAKRRVQHYGYEFMYETRNVNTKHHLGELPSFLSPILKKISSFFPNIIVDQLTVNEYPPGVGLSPHIDTHSAFEGFIFSLSLTGPCIMEFRRYSQGSWIPPDKKGENLQVIKKALFLPPRSMLLLSGEARYAWHHYIPHHKGDAVRGDIIKRASRRVSFTFRKVRNGPCCCEFPQYCDSQSN
ncbi:hypothetical protein AQUCO_00201234v1 [Aquilegia coerulea]|uniref:Fe2OG dioxygenase domain-containing protein n=1 Tax=Aquilegia coerulea TaxID=218851 RepID=A0A2G5F6U8_AQUCA|nr:hypothetical protein AQUCO_00201234v1 [Aquilegia coerulea]